jgi:hypothetical protein
MQSIWESWPEWLTEAVVAAYKAGQEPAMIGAVLGRREAVIRGKLVRLGVYESAAAKRQMKHAEMAEGF